MSFLTSFWDFPQKEQQSVWLSRLSKTTSPAPKAAWGPAYANEGNNRPQASPFEVASAGPGSPSSPLFGGCGLPLGREDVVDEAVLLGLDRPHEVVAIGVPFDALEGLAGVMLEDLVDALLGPQDLLGVDLDVRGLPLEPAERLVDHDPGVRKGVALAGRTSGQEQRRHGGRLPHADGRDRRLHVLHRAVDGHS